MTSLEEGRGAFNISVTQNSTQGTNATIESTRSKRSMNSTKTEIVERDESSPHCRKRKGKVGDAHITKEQSLSNRVPRRRTFTVSQHDEGSQIHSDKGDQLASRNLREPKRKRSREATSNVESHLKTLTKPRKLTKAKNRFSPQLTNVREEISGQIRENLTQGVYSTIISENEKDKSKSQSKELIHSKKSSNLKVFSSQHVKAKIKKKNVIMRRRNLDMAAEHIRTRKISLRDKSRVGKHGTTTKTSDPGLLRGEMPKKTHIRSGSHALHALRKPTLSKKDKNRLSGNVHILETSEVKEQPEGIQNGNGNLDINTGDIRKKIQSKETATALKLAHDTSGFVRMALKVVEDSKNVNLNMKEEISKRKKEDVNMDDKPNRILTTVETRYKSTLESLGIKKTVTAEKMIEESGAIRLGSKGNVTKVAKLGKRHIGRSPRKIFKKHLKDEPIGKVISKENAQSDGIKDRKSDAKQIKLSRKTRKSIENQMKKFGLINKAPQNQQFTPSVATKKSKSLMVSGFDRLISGASGNKEFESALAQIVSSHDDELGWTKEQEKALQNAYLSIKQSDGDFWHLISKEVPGRSTKECYNKFYSRHPTPSFGAQAQRPAVMHQNEIEYSLSLSDSSHTKSQVISPKVTKKQKQLEAQKTIHNILGYVDSMEAYKETNSPTVENNPPNMVRDVESILDRVEDEKAVILQSNPMKDSNTTSLLPHVEEDTHHNQEKSFFENVVISGVRNLSDKENNQPCNGQESNSKKLGVPRVELILKQVDHGENLPDNSRLRTTNNTSRKKKIIKTNNVYLHSKDALDFGDTTLDAIQRAKQELRNVFSRTGTRGGNFFDIEVDHIGD